MNRVAIFAALCIAASAAAQAPKPSHLRPVQVLTTFPPPAPAGSPPASMQWLYGSGEAAAVSFTAFRALQNYAVATARHRPKSSVVLAPDATLRTPRFVPCGRKPLAVVLDVDETALLNVGYEYDQAAQNRAYDPKRWSDWERTGIGEMQSVPGAAVALDAIRGAGIKVIFISNRSLENVARTELALDAKGLGPARHLKELFVIGDAPGASSKDPRRALVASRYCVVAMAGDQLGDFTDIVANTPQGREQAVRPYLSWIGERWFVLPNPAYGSWEPALFDNQWSLPEGERRARKQAALHY